jgi:hypothetical protein
MNVGEAEIGGGSASVDPFRGMPETYAILIPPSAPARRA